MNTPTLPLPDTDTQDNPHRTVRPLPPAQAATLSGARISEDELREVASFFIDRTPVIRVAH